MINSDLEIRTSKLFLILATGATTAGVSFFAYSEREYLFNWTTFYLIGLNTIMFFVFLVACFFQWAKLLDTKPQIIINDEGIQIRKSTLPFSSLRLIKWNEIYFFYFLEKARTNRTDRYLVIKGKESEKRLRLSCINLTNQ